MMYRFSYIISVFIVVIITAGGEIFLESNDLEARKINFLPSKNTRFLHFFFRPLNIVFTSILTSISTTTITCTTRTRYDLQDCYDDAVYYSFKSPSVPGYFRFRGLLDFNEDDDEIISHRQSCSIIITYRPTIIFNLRLFLLWFSNINCLIFHLF